MRTRAVFRLHSFVFAATLVVAAALLRFATAPWLERSVPYLFFYPAILVAGIYKGFWPGLLATGLSAIVAAYSFLEPAHRLAISDQGDVLGLILFW